MAKIFDYFSKFQNKPIYDKNKNMIGRIYDFLAESGQIPKIKQVIIASGFLIKSFVELIGKI